MTRPLLVVRDDVATTRLAPFGTLRPLGAMPVGLWPIAQRWSAQFPAHALCLGGVPGHPLMVDDMDPPLAPSRLPAGSIVAASRAVITASTPMATDASVWTVHGRIAAVTLERETDPSTLDDAALAAAAAGRPTVELTGAWVDRAWDLLSLTERYLVDDLSTACAGADGARDGRVTILGSHPVRIDPSASLEPFVVIDATRGPVWIDAEVSVLAFSRLAGPLYLGRGTQMAGGRIGASMIGPQCRVAGEIVGSVLSGYVNKAHDGFVGHSVIAPWVNLGAGTTTSNLKNSYGTVRSWTPEGVIDTGRQFLGALIGDHAKLGIGTMLSTGSVIGVGANVFGTRRPPTMVPAFAWGDAEPFATVRRAEFLTVASRVMQRRGPAPSPAQLEALASVHAALTRDPR